MKMREIKNSEGSVEDLIRQYDEDIAEMDADWERMEARFYDEMEERSMRIKGGEEL